jgi:hypothetical protein
VGTSTLRQAPRENRRKSRAYKGQPNLCPQPVPDPVADKGAHRSAVGVGDRGVVEQQCAAIDENNGTVFDLHNAHR